MKRKLKKIFSRKSISHLKYIPIIILKIKNWIPFLLNYIGFKEGDIGKEYQFRNGLKFRIRKKFDVALIFLAFIRKDYGKITKNSIVVDIGANIGTFSIFAANSVGNVKVFAYEPMEETYLALKEHVKINNLQQKITPYNLGISAKKEKRKLYLADQAISHALYQKSEDQNYIIINCISIKDIFESNNLEKIDVLKIDCEGAEYEILLNTPIEFLKRINHIRGEFEINKKYKNFDISYLKMFLKENGFKIIKEKRKIIWFQNVMN